MADNKNLPGDLIPVGNINSGAPSSAPGGLPSDLVPVSEIDAATQEKKPQPTQPWVQTTSPVLNAAQKTIRNLPGSAATAAEQMATPFIHPVETGQNFYRLGRGIIEKLGLEKNQQYAKYPDAVGKFFVDRYGGWKNIAKTIQNDPVGFMLDASTVLSGGGTLAAKIPGMVGDIGEAVRATGEAINPVNAVGRGIKAAGTHIGTLLTNIPGPATTFVGSHPVTTAFKAGYEGGPQLKAFRDQLTERTSMEEPVNDMEKALEHMRQVAQQKYLKEIGQVTANPKLIKFDQVDRAVAKARDRFSYGGKSGAAARVVTDRNAEKIFNEMVGLIETFKNQDPREFHTIEGFDEMKQALGNAYRRISREAPNSKSEKIASTLYNAAKETIVKQDPKYAEVMKNYESAQDLIQEIQKTFSVNRKASIDTQLRKLQSVMRDNVNTSFGYRKQLAQHLLDAGAPYLFEKLSGQTLQSYLPRGIGRLAASGEGLIGLLNIMQSRGIDIEKAIPVLIMLGLSSPRLLGNIATTFGAGARAAKSLPYRSLYQAGVPGGINVTPTAQWQNPFEQNMQPSPPISR